MQPVTHDPSPPRAADAPPFDVAIVGAGLAGLTAAVQLARAGRSVALVERAAAPGGRAASERFDDFHLDRGPRALYIGAPAEQALRRLGIEPDGARPPLDGWVLRGEALLPLPSTPWRLLTTPTLPGRARWQAMRAMMALPRGDHRAWAGRPLAAWLAGFAPEAAAILEMYARLSTYCHPAPALDAAATLDQLAAAFVGVRYLHGGWQSLVDRLVEAADRAGVHRITGRAERWSDGRLTLRDGRILPARLPLVAAGPRVADAIYGLAGADRLADGAPAHAACLAVALDELPRPAHRFVLGLDEPLYFAVPSQTARLAPAGGAVMQVMRYLAPDEDGSTARPRLEARLDLIQPGWRDRTRAARWMPRMTVLHRRPTPGVGPAPSEPRPGCFIAGDWVGSHGMLADAAVASAEAAARAIDARLADAASAAA